MADCTTTRRESIATNAGPVEIATFKNTLGWSGECKGRYITRQYAAAVNGVMIRNRAGAIRTFAERSTARAAAITVATAEAAVVAQ